MMKKNKIQLLIQHRAYLCLVLLFVTMGFTMFHTHNSRALTYQNNVNVQFTFNPVIRIDLSGTELSIPNLAPGTASDSNIITVGASTNAAYGYQLGVTVGVKNGTDALVNIMDGTKMFTNLSTPRSTLASFEDNTWGYSYCADTAINCGVGGSATWVSGNVGSVVNGYGGLPLDGNDVVADHGQGGITLINTNGDNNGRVVQFKIGAKAGFNQMAGVYGNTVNFYAVAKPIPEPLPIASCPTPVPNLNYMQDLNSSNKTSILASMIEDAQYFLKDKRDEKIYCVAKLKDGNIWMTQNLDHDIVTTPNYYTNENTDIGWNNSTNSYDVATWTAERATYPSNVTTWNMVEYGDPYGVDGKNHPESYDIGDVYLNTAYLYGQKYFTDCFGTGICDQSLFDSLPSDWQAYLNSCNGNRNNCDNSIKPNYTSSEGAQQYHMGNYYNWTAAIATNDSTSYADDNIDANQSICPTNWTLPKAGRNIGNGSFRYLVEQYGWDYDGEWALGDGYEAFESPMYIGLTGEWWGDALSNYDDGAFLWSPMVSNYLNSYVHTIKIDGGIDPGVIDIARENGLVVRCLTR